MEYSQMSSPQTKASICSRFIFSFPQQLVGTKTKIQQNKFLQMRIRVRERFTFTPFVNGSKEYHRNGQAHNSFNKRQFANENNRNEKNKTNNF